MKNIIFDLGGVILDIDIGKTQQAFADMGMPDIDNFFRIGYAASFFREYEAGHIDDAEFLRRIREHAGQPIDDETIIEAWNIMLLDFPPARIELLKELGIKRRIFLLSNTNNIHLIAFRRIFARQFRDMHFDELFEKAYYSHEIKLRKPDLPSYRFVLEQHGLAPRETVFIDDAIVNVEAARSAGIHGIHLEQGKQLTDPDIVRQLEGL